MRRKKRTSFLDRKRILWQPVEQHNEPKSFYCNLHFLKVYNFRMNGAFCFKLLGFVLHIMIEEEKLILKTQYFISY